MPDPRRISEQAAPTRPTAHDDYAWHYVLHRAGRPPSSGERLASLVLAPADVAGYGLAELVTAGRQDATAREQLAAGLGVLERAMEAERREWVRRLARSGYVDGWGVAIVRERGRRRRLFSGIPGLAGARILTPDGGTTT